MLAALFASPVRTFVIAVAVFVPFERLAGRRAAQRVLRRGWAMDLLTGVINGLERMPDGWIGRFFHPFRRRLAPAAPPSADPIVSVG